MFTEYFAGPINVPLPVALLFMFFALSAIVSLVFLLVLTILSLKKPISKDDVLRKRFVVATWIVIIVFVFFHFFNAMNESNRYQDFLNENPGYKAMMESTQ